MEMESIGASNKMNEDEEYINQLKNENAQLTKIRDDLEQEVKDLENNKPHSDVMVVSSSGIAQSYENTISISDNSLNSGFSFDDCLNDLKDQIDELKKSKNKYNLFKRLKSYLYNIMYYFYI